MKNMKKTVLALLACPLLAQAAGTVDLSSLDRGMGRVDPSSITYSGNCVDSIKRLFWPQLGIIDIKSNASEYYVSVETESTVGVSPSFLTICSSRLDFVSGDSSSGFNLEGQAQCTLSHWTGNAAVTASLRRSAGGRRLLGKIVMGFQDPNGNVFCTGTGNLYNPK